MMWLTEACRAISGRLYMAMNECVSKHYDPQYFSWQSSIGEFGGWANLTKFIEFIKDSDDVMDFGCGGGYLLKNIKCHRKIGVEINPSAAEVAQHNGIEVYSSTLQVPDDYVNVIISNNALEHSLHPLYEIKTLYSKLRQGGKIIIIVPCESIYYTYKANDINHHLYSWSPMCIGNLFSEAGYTVIESKPYIHKWPPYYRQLARFGGRKIFELACRVYGRIERSWFQVRVVAKK